MAAAKDDVSQGLPTVPDMVQLSPGDKAPAITLLDQTGAKVRLSGFKGRKVMVFFYPKADTPGCTTQACGLRDLAGDIGDTVVLGISPDLPPKLEKFDTSMYMLGWGGAVTDAETTLTPVMRNLGAGGIGSYNYGRSTNAKFDDLAAKSSVEADPAKRIDLIIEAQQVALADFPYVPLWWGEAATAIKDTLTACQLKMPQLAMPVRVLVMGTAQTPSLDAVLALSRKEIVLARLSKA